MRDVPALSPPLARSGRISAWADRHIDWLLVAPAVLLILALSIYPLAYSLWVSFVNYDFLVPGHAFVGLGNFAQVVADPVAQWALLTTVLLATANVATEFALGLVLALAMDRQFRGRSAVMSLLIVPLFISPVIVGQFWSLLLQRPFGPVDYLLGVLVGHPVNINWLTRETLELHRARRRRCVAMDAVHVRHPARRADLLAARAVRGGRGRRRQRLAGVPLHHHAADGADGDARDHVPPARCDQAVRHHLHDDRRRPGHAAPTPPPSTSIRSASCSSTSRRRRPEAGCS